MAKKTKRTAQRRDDGSYERELQKFLNQPNINMVVPWIYDIYKNMAKPKSRQSRDGEEQQVDPVEKDLECFLNQPNINMTIPWIYQIAKSVKESSGSDHDLRWTDDTGEEEG